MFPPTSPKRYIRVPLSSIVSHTSFAGRSAKSLDCTSKEQEYAYVATMKCNQDSKNSQAQQLGTGQSLLKFMDMASDTVKCAMSKPTNFKKNINHRRYLQRQVRSFVKSGRSKANCGAKKAPASNLRDDVQHLVREAIKELRFSYAGQVHGGHVTTAVLNPVPMQSHLGITCNSARFNATYRLTHLPSKPLLSVPDFVPSTPKLEKEPSPCFVSSSCTPEDDMFMSGEELTNNIDINDLYIPELHEPKSPVVNCDDYFAENDLEIPSPLHDSPYDSPTNSLQFEFDSRHQLPPNLRTLKFH